MSMPMLTPADVHSLPSTPWSASASPVSAGKRAASRAQLAQWVATRLPLSRPAQASTNTPVQTDP
jgi:hypothetical protein